MNLQVFFVCLISIKIITGGNDDVYGGSVMKFNRYSEEWAVIGQMKKKRYYHGMSVIDYDADC